jgi:hypothetical protein
MHRCYGRRRWPRSSLRTAHGGLVRRRAGSGWLSRPTSGSFLLAMFGHAGTVCIDLLVTPEVLGITGGPEAALVNGLRALLTYMDAAAFLHVARRCQRGHRTPTQAQPDLS